MLHCGVFLHRKTSAGQSFNVTFITNKVFYFFFVSPEDLEKLAILYITEIIRVTNMAIRIYAT